MLDPVVIAGLATLGAGAVLILAIAATWFLVGKWMDMIDGAYPRPQEEDNNA